MMYFNLYVPAGVWGVILVVLLVLLAHAGLSVFNYWSKKKKIPYDNEVGGIIFNVLSLIYSLIIAFVIVAVWENYEDLNRTIEEEADDLNSVLLHSNMLPDSLRGTVSLAVKTYCQIVVEEEWDMLEGKERYRQSAIPSLRLLLFQVETDSKIQGNLLSIIDDNLSNISNLRRERLSHTRSYVPEVVWTILLISSVLVICFSYFLYMESEQLRRIFLSFLWTIIGMSLYLLYMLDHPFIDGTQVSKAPFEEIIKNLSKE